MKTESCREWRESLGAYALGHLAAEERAGLEAHLEGCADCRAEADSLALVARLLPPADPERFGPAPDAAARARRPGRAADRGGASRRPAPAPAAVRPGAQRRDRRVAAARWRSSSSPEEASRARAARHLPLRCRPA